MRERKDFWDRNAVLYDRFIRKDGAAYEMMYEMIQPVVRHKTVLEPGHRHGADRQAHRERGGSC